MNEGPPQEIRWGNWPEQNRKSAVGCVALELVAVGEDRCGDVVAVAVEARLRDGLLDRRRVFQTVEHVRRLAVLDDVDPWKVKRNPTRRVHALHAQH